MTDAAAIDWSTLGFGYVRTNGHVRYTWKDGKWDGGELVAEDTINLHIMASVLHYGQSLFEGLKAFRHKDGSVHVFGPHGANAARLERGCRRFLMPVVPPELFDEAIDRAIKANIDFVPPYGTAGSLYIRPYIFGSGPKLGLGPSPEYTFIVMVNPVGNYYSKDGLQSVDALVIDDYDRAAPLGVGSIKAGGNYAADLEPSTRAKESGFPIALYLDPKHHRFVEEFSTSNFIGIDKDGGFVTPDTPKSVLASITNIMLQVLAKEELGITVTRRDIDYAELSSFKEIGACGTAVVLSPVKRIVRHGHPDVHVADHPTQLTKLHDMLLAIQVGDMEDKHGWTRKVA